MAPFSPLADLPSEIILEVLAFAACSSKKTAIALTYVSSWVKHATAPYVYATVILRSARQINAFLALIRQHDGSPNGKHIVNPAPFVRNICITHHAPWRPQGEGTETDPYGVIFSSCTNVRHAALQSTFLHSSLVPHHPVHRLRCNELMVLGPTFPSDWEKHAEASAPRVLSLDGGDDIDPNEAREEHNETGASVLQHTTHLRLLESLSSPQFSGPHLTLLPRLTHLALLIREQIYSTNPFTELDPLLASPQLRMVVVSFDFRTWVDKKRGLDDWAKLARKVDDRLFAVERDRGDPLKHWARAVHGGDDIWSRAVREQTDRDSRKTVAV
ncbi:hypothetical protein BD410DRAFT_791441 [Rickenella mellea]|uniref:F-box domain-containing protein n=1 Tax=Rickenella mellea TaxID=50990 RepID=A0A4Y7PXD7_9AGAM|nr:hypothetical protein BD410DRAFT_791441 [Rickenella mellea]